MKKKILIIEDERIIAEDIKNTLIRLGYDVCDIVSSGEEALHQSSSLQPDVVLMDIMLHGNMNGIEAGRRIREELNIPIVFLTSYADDKTLQEAKLADPFGYLLKPFEDRELHVMLEIAFYKIRMEKLLTESEIKYRTLVESVDDGILTLNEHDRITFSNAAASNILGQTVMELQGQHLVTFADKTSRQLLETSLLKCKSGMPERIDLSLAISTSGEEKRMIIDLRLKPILKDKQYQGSFAVFNDITMRKEREVKLLDSEQALSQQVLMLRNKLKADQDLDNYLGTSREISRVRKQVELVATTGMSVIIQGRSGTGKEVIAKLIHSQSNRRQNPLIAVDCGAIPATLIESELFGYEKGAFTGAENIKIGKFELAQHGTILLDELGNLPLDGQTRLLRALEERQIYRIGGKTPISVDVRIIATTNINLEQAVTQGTFREDLFHRLNEFMIFMPELRERKDDIILLANYFRKTANHELGKEVPGFNPASIEILYNYNWPGNIRELKHVVKRAVLLASNQMIQPADLLLQEIISSERNSNQVLQTKLIFDSNNTLNSMITDLSRQAEKEIITTVLKQVRNNKSKAARILGIDRTTLYAKLNVLDLEY